MYRRTKPHDGGSPRPNHDGPSMTDASSSKHKTGSVTPGTASKGKVAKRLLSYHVEEHPMTALEYFIYIFTVLFVAVFVIMQIVFMIKLYRFEQSHNDESSLQQGRCNDTTTDMRALTTTTAEQQQLQLVFPISDGQNSNRIRIQIMANQTRRKALTKWPPLDAIVDPKDGTTMIGNPQFLLDFAVIGFEKCGYQTLKLLLSGHKQLDCPIQENYKLYLNKPADFVQDMYDMHTGDAQLKRCYNNNADIFQPCTLTNIHQHFNETKLIIALRHPVRFFESLYNARIQNLPDPNKQIPSPHERIGICKAHDNGCCTDHAHMALWLYKLGKTLEMPPAEIEDIIKNTHAYESEHTTHRTKNKVFLVETSQLVDQDWFRQQELMDDLQAFLDLDYPFKNGIPQARPAPKSDTQAIRDKRKIDICRAEFKDLREELMQAARESSVWIRERFLKSPDVFVSSPDFFEQAIGSWMDDPCDPMVPKKGFDTKTIEGEIPFQASEEAGKLPVQAGELTKFNISEKWPALQEIVTHDDQLIGDPQFLLDFAIIGIEKSGTSTLMKWLGAHPQIQCFQHEDTSLFNDKPAYLAKRLYNVYPGENYKRGYKNPIDIFQPCVLRNFQQIFPQTKLLLTIRHPVRYFESLHNFRIQNLPDPNQEFTPALERIGICGSHSQGLCTDHAHFALWIYRLGKTVDMTDSVIQKRIVDIHPYEAHHYVYPSENKVFLTEMTQFMDKDPERMGALKRDLADFLGLTHTFDEDAPHAIPGMKWSAESQAIRDSRKIDICEEQYRPLRSELMKGARETSIWIRTFFLASKDVFVSSPDAFDEAMRAWMNDPCEDESQADPRSKSNWPRLSSLVNEEGEIIGDVQFLLDFAIVGIEKCGTSTLMIWLDSHPEMLCDQVENYNLVNNKPGQLVQDLYAMAPYEDYKRGYKNPMELFYPTPSLKYLDEYFPKTKLIITIRHPVLYFQSLHNFRIQNHNEGNWNRSHIATAFDRVGPCIGVADDGCTEHAHFGLWLYRFGKTLSLPETETEQILRTSFPYSKNLAKPKAMENPIFLTEMSQFADKDAGRQAKLRSDLREFLGVRADFNSTAPHKVPGKKWTKEIQAVRDSFKIDICEEKFKPVRDVLMKGARETSIWIRESFIKAPDVHISSPEFFDSAMRAWMDDPCDSRINDHSHMIRKNLFGDKGQGVREELTQN